MFCMVVLILVKFQLYSGGLIMKVKLGKSMLHMHTNFKCTLAGLVINPLYPYLGASPDGFVSCDCCDEAAIEIKCPYSGHDCHPKDLRDFVFNNNSKLKRSHRKTFLYMLYHSRSMISLLLHESEAEPRTSVNNKDIILLL